MNIHLPAILGFTRYQGFDTLPFEAFWNLEVPQIIKARQVFWDDWYAQGAETIPNL